MTREPELTVCEYKTYTFPVGLERNNDISLTAIFPMTPDQWDTFWAVLQASKPGLVETD